MSDSACQNYENAFVRRRCNEVLNLPNSVVLAGNGQSRRVRDYYVRLKIQPSQVPARRYVNWSQSECGGCQRAILYIISPDSTSFHLILDVHVARHVVPPHNTLQIIYETECDISKVIRVYRVISPITVRRDVLTYFLPPATSTRQILENLQNVVTFV